MDHGGLDALGSRSKIPDKREREGFRKGGQQRASRQDGKSRERFKGRLMMERRIATSRFCIPQNPMTSKPLKTKNIL